MQLKFADGGLIVTDDYGNKTSVIPDDAGGFLVILNGDIMGGLGSDFD